ncbi:MAG: hypothetical protein M3Z09_18605 [Acidobacteriota bacterium]|nr:hypothetical protein [Acidobacteriota bacterium]
MELIEDYTIRNGLGIRVAGRKTCQVIRRRNNVWQEIGRVYAIPVAEEELRWGSTGIPTSVLAVAVRAYELDHPTSKLRAVLTRRIAHPCLQQAWAAVNG